MADDTYDIGDRTRLSVYFEADGSPADPSIVLFQVRHVEDDEYTEYTYSATEGIIKRPSLGEYYVDFTWDKSGTWYYRFVGEGAVAAATDYKIKVRRSNTLQL